MNAAADVAASPSIGYESNSSKIVKMSPKEVEKPSQRLCTDSMKQKESRLQQLRQNLTSRLSPRLCTAAGNN